MAIFTEFLKQLAHDVYYGEGDPDNPPCPECGDTMTFHGGERPIGEGYWECACGCTFTEDDLPEFDD